MWCEVDGDCEWWLGLSEHAEGVTSFNQPTNINPLSSLSESINKIDTNLRNSCDEDLNIEEVIDCINSLKENKSHGSDGLTRIL